MINNSLRLFSAAALASVAACAHAAAPPPGFQGVVELDERVVAFEVPGRVQDVPVRRGDLVPDGEVIAKLDDTMERLTLQARVDDVNTARADLALLEAGSRREDIGAVAADVRAARAAEDLAKKTAARVHALFQSGSLAQADVDRADSDLERATFQRQSLEQHLAALQHGARPQEIARAKARLEAATAAVSLEEERLARHVLRAKGTGAVLDVHVKTGELAGVGTPAVTMADLAHPYVDVFVPQGQLDGVKIGVAANVKVDATAAAFPGRVEYIAPKTEFTPRFLFTEQERPHIVVRVRVRLDDPEQRVHAGVPAFVRFVK